MLYAILLMLVFESLTSVLACWGVEYGGVVVVRPGQAAGQLGRGGGARPAAGVSGAARRGRSHGCNGRLKRHTRLVFVSPNEALVDANRVMMFEGLRMLSPRCFKQMLHSLGCCEYA
jgi:hypothetical protein